MKWTVNGWTYGHFPYNTIGEPTAVPEVTLTVPSFDNGRPDE